MKQIYEVGHNITLELLNNWEIIMQEHEMLNVLIK